MDVCRGGSAWCCGATKSYKNKHKPCLQDVGGSIGAVGGGHRHCLGDLVAVALPDCTGTKKKTL